MAQENFAGPEYFTEFDPEKFIRDLKEIAEMEKENKAAAERGATQQDADSLGEDS